MRFDSVVLAAIWVSVSIASSTAALVTSSLTPFWFFLVPALLSFPKKG